ncbi:MAG: hypothetical protein D6698_04745 [Gammaproteobacteria bacterium]|nr:MAG: hypothetical protein D6698_04745 [Gammaproteobacteria bacterium]
MPSGSLDLALLRQNAANERQVLQRLRRTSAKFFCQCKGPVQIASFQGINTFFFQNLLIRI